MGCCSEASQLPTADAQSNGAATVGTGAMDWMALEPRFGDKPVSPSCVKS